MLSKEPAPYRRFQMKVIVTMPAYNEEKTIGRVIKDVKKEMGKTKHKYEILVVDDGSGDRTSEIAKRSGATVITLPYRYGLAEVFRTEMEHSLKQKPDIIVHIDADGQYLPGEIPKLIKPIESKEADLVLGSRFLGTIEGMPAIKRFGNRAFSRVISRVTGVRITDAQTGFRAFTREFAEKVKIISKHTYTQEMVIKGIREKFRIKEIPIYFAKRREGKSKLVSNPFGYAIRAWINILRIYRDYEPLKFFGVIGLVLMGMGFLIGCYFIYLQLIGTGIVGDLGKLFLMIILLFSGLQIIVFGFLADKE